MWGEPHGAESTSPQVAHLEGAWEVPASASSWTALDASVRARCEVLP